MKIGIDIGGSHISIGLVKDQGKIIYKEEKDIYINETVKNDVPKIIENVIITEMENMLKNNNIKIQEIEKIGIAVPGTVNERSIVQAKNLFLNNFSISDIINEHYKNVSIKLINDAKAAANAEKEYGSLKKYSDAVFLTIGTGVGGAVFLDDKLLRPKRFEGFEIGHMIICKDGLKCNCGKNGCFEKYASMSAFKSKIIKALNIDKNLTGKELRDILLKNIANKNIQKCIDEYIEYLSIGISNLINIFEPEAISFGGSFVYYEDIFIDKLKKRLKNNNLIFNNGSMPEFKMATLENDAGIIGATI